MKTNKLLAVGILGVAGFLWWKNRQANPGPTNAFGAPLNAEKPAQFGFNTSRLNPVGTRQATNATANGGNATNQALQTGLAAIKTIATLFQGSAGSKGTTAGGAKVTTQQAGPHSTQQDYQAALDSAALDNSIAEISFDPTAGIDFDPGSFDAAGAFDDFGIA